MAAVLGLSVELNAVIPNFALRQNLFDSKVLMATLSLSCQTTQKRLPKISKFLFISSVFVMKNVVNLFFYHLEY